MSIIFHRYGGAARNFPVEIDKPLQGSARSSSLPAIQFIDADESGGEGVRL
jgi:hypothetical protein